jgi:hypothetical protein
MTIEELNKLIKEELEAYLGEDEEDGGDDIEVTTDEPEDKGDEALDTLRQIFNMLKPLVEPEDEEEPDLDDEGEDSDEELDEGKKDEADEDMKEGKDDEKDEDEKKNEAVGYPNYRADQISKVKADATDVNQGLNESIDMAARWKKLANIK